MPIGERDTTAGVSGSTLYWLGDDVDGTPDVETSVGSGKTVYRFTDPFGNPRGAAASWPSDRGFLDDPESTLTGLTQVGARLYNPQTGSFTTTDPLLTATSFASRNAYAGNSPVTNTDPSGECLGPGAISNITNCTGSQGSVTAKSATYLASTPAQQVQGYTPWDGPAPAKASHVSAGSSSGGSSGGSTQAAAACAHLGLCSAAYQKEVTDPEVVAGEDKIMAAAGFGSLDLVLIAGTFGGDLFALPGEVGAEGAATAGIDAAVDAGADGAGDEVAAGARAACGGESFTPGTKVVLASGAAVAIATLTVGAKVLATDPKTGKTTAKTVQQLWVNHDDDLMDLTVKAGGGTSVIHTTQHHLFWDDTTHTWVEADDLAPGDQLRTDDGTTVTAASTRIIPGRRYVGPHRRRRPRLLRANRHRNGCARSHTVSSGPQLPEVDWADGSR